MVVEDGKILDVMRSPRSSELPSKCREESGFSCPGFIDLQINGAFGIDVGPDAKALEALSRELPKTGVTSLLPTAISWLAGRITPGADADLVVLSTEGMVEETVVAGETVYHGRGESHVR
ncbi:MAG: hypothetical protein H0X23_06545 [Rubrobacter sp.]|jgi:N-acetylglucosamine-6-phosphate deacetylase|nr:hypothetical protein [Rubrobacter sp.]